MEVIVSHVPASLVAPGGPKPAATRSPHWPSVRAAHLKLQPTCQVCTTAEHLNVHHCLPFHLHPDLELLDSNLLTLCESAAHNCHLIFGHGLLWAAYNPNVRRDAALARAMIQTRRMS